MYPAIYRKLKHIVTQFFQHLKLATSETHKGRPAKITKENALTLALYQHQSTRATKKSVYEDFKDTLKCSYKTLVCQINQAGIMTSRILLWLMRTWRKFGHPVKYTDATDIPVCLNKNAKNHKTMKHLAGWGHSGKGFYYGLKMTITRDAAGHILALRFTAPSANDRDICRNINKDINGIIVLDASYVSEKLERDMYIENKRWLLIKPYKSMKKLCTAWQYHLYNTRFRIEFDFRSMKLFHGLVTSLTRSINGSIANYLNAILSFALA